MGVGGSMRASKLIVSFATLCMVAAPMAVAQADSARPAQVESSTRPVRKPASAEDLEQYAQREKAAEKLEKFEGGRGRSVELTTIILVLLIVILVLIII
jgi:hypothetical protein